MTILEEHIPFKLECTSSQVIFILQKNQIFDFTINLLIHYWLNN